MAVVIRIARPTARSVRSGIPSLPHRAFFPISSASSLSTRPRVAYRLVSQLAADAPTFEEPHRNGPEKINNPAKDLTDGASPFQVTFNFRKVTFTPPASKGSAEGQILDTVQDIYHLWLRDNCRCSQCVNQATMQRNFRIFDVPENITPTEVTIESEGVRIIWDHEHHESFYDWTFIKRHVYRLVRPQFELVTRRRLWGSEIAADPPTVTYEEVMDSTSESGMARLTDSLVKYGLVFVDNTPFDDAVHTKNLLGRIGPIRETHYGGFYDFVPDMAKADTAYTNIALPAHTDTTYFTDPAGLQAFHMLSHTGPEGSLPTGGESLLVDGIHAAEILRKEDPKAFRILHTQPVSWHASGNQGVTITPDILEPVIHIYPSNKETGPVYRIRWNNDDRAVMQLQKDPDYSARWYEAARKFDKILRGQSLEYWFQLKPGRTLIFDNYRVLHGRSAFTGLRRMCGAYINRDDFVSRWRNSNFPREEVLAQVIG